MAWMESHQELGRHPKLYKLARLLGINKWEAIGHLQCLWWWALDFAQTGSLDKYDVDDIVIAAEWEDKDKKDKFIPAMIEAGFIDKDEKGVLWLHDWMDYAGKLIAKRIEDKLRKRQERMSNGCPTDISGNSKPSSVTVQYSTVQNSTVQNTTLPNSSSKFAHGGNEANSKKGAKKNAKPQTEFNDERFVKFWNEYPRKIAKKNCQLIWEKLNVTDELFEKIMNGLSDYKYCEQWQADDGKYIPYPATWLNQARWNDDILTDDEKFVKTIHEIMHKQTTNTEGDNNGRANSEVPPTY